MSRTTELASLRPSHARAALVGPINRALIRLVLALLLPLGAITGSARAQDGDLYDPTILRLINLQFHDANWWALLQANYQSQTNILADLTMDGATYPNVGVRIRGNTSYTAPPAGSQKVSLNIDLDQVEAGQDLLGCSSLNLNNGFRDPTFFREVVYNNFVTQFMPNARADHVVLSLNGANWGGLHQCAAVQQGSAARLLYSRRWPAHQVCEQPERSGAPLQRSLTDGIHRA